MRYEFLDFVLDLNSLELRRGPEAVHVEPQVFSLIVYLIQKRERVVSKDELIDAVWNGRVIADSTFTSRVNAARRALGDDGKAQRVIQTVPRRGFRFVPAIRTPHAAAPKTPDSAVEDHSAKPSIAVLPLRYLGLDPNQDFLIDGITEDIISALSRFRNLFVISPRTSFAYKGRAIEAGQAGRELGVSYIVEGSARLIGERIRVTAELTDARTGVVLWTETYDHAVDDMLAIQARIAHAAAGSIEPELNDSEAVRMLKPGSDDWRVRVSYYRGLKHLYAFTESDLEQAERLLTEATRDDPTFALAHARLGYVHIQRFWYGVLDERGARIEAALACARRAIALDSREAFAHFVLGRALALQALYDQAIDELRLAVQLNPSLAQAHFGLGQALFYANRSNECLPHLDLAVQLSPRDPHLWTFHHVKALALFDLGRFDEAEQEATRAIHSANATHWAFATLLAVLGAQRKGDKAVFVAGQLRALKPDYSCAFARREFAGFIRDEFVAAYVAGLHAAGVPA